RGNVGPSVQRGVVPGVRLRSELPAGLGSQNGRVGGFPAVAVGAAMRPTLSLQPMLSSSRRSSCALLLCLIGAATTHAQAPAPRTAADTISAARLAQNAMLRIGDLDSAATFWTEDIVVLAGLGARQDGRA